MLLDLLQLLAKFISLKNRFSGVCQNYT